MKTIDTELTIEGLTYPVERIAGPEELLFFDIETTGFTAKGSQLFLIGCGYYADPSWHCIQWFAESPEEEADVISAFFDFSRNYSRLIHFNGNRFDIPYVTEKCTQLGLMYRFDELEGIDFYKRIHPLRHLLGLADCKQRTIEEYLGIYRDDRYSGKEIISLYNDYLSTGLDSSLAPILLHNLEDIKGMLRILPMLAYSDMYGEASKVTKVTANSYEDLYGADKQELILKLSFPSPLPKFISRHADRCYFSASETTGTLKVPLYEEELKYFYSNYRDYYYLPREDTALHKSVATYVDREFRMQAKASNCYTRKASTFLPQWSDLFTPFFKTDYDSKELYFELTEEMKTDRKAFNAYAQHILERMLRE